MSFDENNAYNITKRLAFPRLIGSNGEKKAIDIVVDEFKKAGFDAIYREKFLTSFYHWVISRYLFLLLSVLLILIGLVFFINPWLTLIFLGIFFLSFLKTLRTANSSEILLSKNSKNNFETENIYTKLKSKNSKATVIFMSHWDSKSQTFSVNFRIIIIMISAFGGLSLSILYLILTLIQLIIRFESILLNITLFILVIFIAINGLLNFFNKAGNNSPGAYDNAAAVGILIELAKCFKIHPIENIDFIFLSTSSEELNLGGAKYFIKKYGKEFDKNSTYFINFDPIGGNELIRIITSFGVPRKSSSKKLNELFLSSAMELKLAAKNYYLPTGAWSDYMPIVREGFEACWIATTPGGKYVHTKKDDMNLIDIIALKNVLNLSLEVIKKLNKELS